MDIINSVVSTRREDLFQATAVSPISQFSRTFKALNTQIRTSPSQKLPLTLSILDDLFIAQEMLAQTTIPPSCTDSLRKEINGLEREAKGVGAVGVGDVVEDVKRRGQNVASLPPDGNIIDLTTDVPPTPPPADTLDNDKTRFFNAILKTTHPVTNVPPLRILEPFLLLPQHDGPPTTKPRHRLARHPRPLDNGRHRHTHLPPRHQS